MLFVVHLFNTKQWCTCDRFFYKTKIIEKWTIYYYLTISIAHLNYRKKNIWMETEENGCTYWRRSIKHHSYCFICNHIYTAKEAYQRIKWYGNKEVNNGTRNTTLIRIVRLIWSTYGKWPISSTHFAGWVHGMGGFKHINPCIVLCVQVKSSMVFYTHGMPVLNWFFSNGIEKLF